MTDEHFVILKEYFCVYFTGFYKVDYLCLANDLVLTCILWAELTVTYSIVYFKLTLCYYDSFELNKVIHQKHNQTVGM